MINDCSQLLGSRVMGGGWMGLSRTCTFSLSDTKTFYGVWVWARACTFGKSERERENSKLETDEYDNIVSWLEKRGKYNCILSYDPKKLHMQLPLVCLSNLDSNHTEHLYTHHSKGKGNLVSLIFTPILLSNRIHKWLRNLDNFLTTLMHSPSTYI